MKYKIALHIEQSSFQETLIKKDIYRKFLCHSRLKSSVLYSVPLTKNMLKCPERKHLLNVWIFLYLKAAFNITEPLTSYSNLTR